MVTGALPGVSLLHPRSLPVSQGKTNFLILGFAGAGHSGGDLSDTILFVSVDSTTRRIVLLSIPRDLWDPSLQAKVNTAYHYGFEKSATEGGLLMAKTTISEVIRERIHFVVGFDFSYFTSLIDLLNGIDVVVDKSFTDSLYPIAGKENDLCAGDPDFTCRYERIRFEAGLRHFDGATALKFVRSRHSEDLEEGTDFARSERQAKVISAVKSKLFSLHILTNPNLLSRIYSLTANSVISDISSDYYSSLLFMGWKARNFKFITSNLDNDSILEHPANAANYNNQWVLVPVKENSSAISEYVDKLLSGSQ